MHDNDKDVSRGAWPASSSNLMALRSSISAGSNGLTSMMSKRSGSNPTLHKFGLLSALKASWHSPS